MANKKLLFIAVLFLFFVSNACSAYRKRVLPAPVVEQPKPEPKPEAKEYHYQDPKKMDSDFDDVPDYLDKCPNIYGLKENNGCPGRYAEEIAYSDSYSEEIGWEKNYWDKDRDGIPDVEDRCPTIPGPLSNHGCPTSGAKKPENAIDKSNIDTTLSRAQLGFSFYKMIPMEETRDFRVNVVINGKQSKVRSNIRKIEKQELEFSDINDTSIVGYIDTIAVYRKLKVSLECDPNDFTVTPFDSAVKDEQEIDFIKGNNWHWNVRAVSKTPHTGLITLKVEGITPQGVRDYLKPRKVDIEIVIGHPKPFLSKILPFISSNSWIMSLIIIPVFLYYRKRIITQYRNRKS